MSEPVLALAGVERSYPQPSGRLEVLRGVDLQVQAGELVALVAPSGAGKSTLLHTAGLLERAQAGSIRIAGQACERMNDAQRTAMRRRSLGFVYQFHHLLPEFTALENVMLPQRIAGHGRGAARERAAALLGELGLGERLDHVPGKLSGGEQQRVAIARALANGPVLLLADEPTGNLDEATSDVVFGELLRLAREHGLAALIATHNTALARRMDRVVRLHDGRLIEGAG
ncbi:MAG TPA: ABC transporter ATP-binding protein [Alphaproteobacteria bacterium]|nr:ABC transporter ATP-binding protein [Alphaproteobacteria bacterium]